MKLKYQVNLGNRCIRRCMDQTAVGMHPSGYRRKDMETETDISIYTEQPRILNNNEKH